MKILGVPIEITKVSGKKVWSFNLFDKTYSLSAVNKSTKDMTECALNTIQHVTANKLYENYVEKSNGLTKLVKGKYRLCSPKMYKAEVEKNGNKNLFMSHWLSKVGGLKDNILFCTDDVLSLKIRPVIIDNDGEIRLLKFN